MPGPPKKPTALKLVQGNPSKRPLNTREPQPEKATLKKPRGLSKEAARHWKSLAEQLIESGILTEIDKPALMMLCEAWARWINTQEILRTQPLVIKTSKGYPIQNPYISIGNKAFEQVHKMFCEFGMTPAARSRIELPEPEKADPMQEFLNRGKKA